MNVIKFNNEEFEVEGYNKNTYFTGETITSNANCSLNNCDMEALNALAQETITTIEILHDGVSIYKIEDLTAKIESINESLGGDRMYINVTFIF